MILRRVQWLTASMPEPREKGYLRVLDGLAAAERGTSNIFPIFSSSAGCRLWAEKGLDCRNSKLNQGKVKTHVSACVARRTRQSFSMVKLIVGFGAQFSS